MTQLKEVVALAPQDTLSAQLVRQPRQARNGIGPARRKRLLLPARGAGQAGECRREFDLAPSNDTTIGLTIGDDGAFTWTVAAKGKPRELAGKWSLADDLLTLAQKEHGGALVGRVTWRADDRWGFRVIGTGPEDRGCPSPDERR